MCSVPRVGAYILEALTTGMYSNPLDALREYVQNAADAIHNARKVGLIGASEGRVEVHLDGSERRLRVVDNGTGIQISEAYRTLVDIGISTKLFSEEAGFRGIGRLAGIAYCRGLSFRTSAIGEHKATVVKLDCERLRKSISPTVCHEEELTDIVDKCSSVAYESCHASEHFFEVIMEDVSVAVPTFLDHRELEKYLCQVAPVEFDAQRFVFGPQVKSWAQQHLFSLPTVTLVIRTPTVERQVFKPYKTHYTTREWRGATHDVQVTGVRFFPDSPMDDTPYWVWYAVTNLPGMIDDSRAAGLRLRRNNMLLGGPERMAEIFGELAETNRRFNDYYIGEVHVTSPNAIPNARRDAFEDLGTWPVIRGSLREFARARCEDVRKASQARNLSITKLVSDTERVIHDISNQVTGGLVSGKQRDALDKQAVSVLRRGLGLAVRRNVDEDEQARLDMALSQLTEVRKSLKSAPAFAIDKLRPDLDRKQRRIIRDILAVLYDMLDNETFGRAKHAILAKFSINEGDLNRG